MKLTGPYHGRRNPAVGKAFYIRELRGQLIMCKWPRRRGRPRHPTTIAQNEKFYQANWATKFIPAAIQQAHRQIVEGTNLLPRDLLIAAMYGRGFDFVIPGHRRRYPIAAIQDLSATLDILGALPGDIIARGPELWVKVRPTQAGQSLISQSAGQPPVYQTIGSQAGLWVQIEDVTLPADLGLNVLHNVAIPANVKEVRAIVMFTPNATGVSLATRLNNDAGANYFYSQMATDSAGALQSAKLTAQTSLLFEHSGNVPNVQYGRLAVEMLQHAGNGRVQISAVLSGGFVLQTHATGQWTNLGAALLSNVGFMSVAGVGLRAGTRIIVQATIQ